MLRVLVLIVQIHNTATGELLSFERKVVPEFSISGNRQNDCRADAIAKYKPIVEELRKTIPYATANIDCRWHSEKGKEI